MRLHNAPVHIGSEAEVIRIDYQLFSHTQNNFNWMVRNFLGLACMSLASA